MRTQIWAAPLALLTFAIAQPAFAAYGWRDVSTLAMDAPGATDEVVVEGPFVGARNASSSSGELGFDGRPYSASAVATALSTEGALKISGRAAMTGAAMSFARSQVFFSDELTFETGVASELLTVNYSFLVKHSQQGTYYSSKAEEFSLAGYFRFQHTVDGIDGKFSYMSSSSTWDPAAQSFVEYKESNVGPGDIYGLYTVSAQVSSGRSTDVAFSLRQEAWVNPDQSGYASADASYDFSAEMYWGGISSVTRADGSAVEFSLSSGSGVDYLKSYIPSPVPEPSSWALLGFGALLVGYATRRDRSLR
ncbi:PEP-CTERM sorting domain-containing protein [Aquincola sp. J276]|uniref:PEP-CTERM sorting domain-containing protein n=1 Tax=Aquincola sp. J276 TaxID=2898432 RepID=UPI002151BE29|nr:PEP-CTERM sorting domain-containing protein [Aquincola sp. J276]MCR5865675.1 PEP-CTERM sorting domain-containing protein [Aquincola sp. J276]